MYANKCLSLHSDRFSAFCLVHQAFVLDGWSKLMADSRPKGPQLRLDHLRVGELLFFTPMHPFHSMRPCGLVQAIFWHTCPDLDLDPWYCLIPSTYIALSGSMTSRVWVSARSRPSPPLYPHFNWPSGFWSCVKSCLVGGSEKYRLHSDFYISILENILLCANNISSGSFKSFINKIIYIHILYSIYVYKEDLALNSLQCLVYYKTQANLNPLTPAIMSI